MGRIFGISDLPVSIPTTPFEPIYVPKPQAIKKQYVTPEANYLKELKMPQPKTRAFMNITNNLSELVSCLLKGRLK